MAILPDSAKIQLQCTNCPNNLPTTSFLQSDLIIKESGNKILNFIQETVQDTFLKEFMNNSNLDVLIYGWLLILIQEDNIKLEELDSNKNLNIYSKCCDKVTDDKVYVFLRDSLAENSINLALDKIIEELQKHKLERICIHSFIDLNNLINLEFESPPNKIATRSLETLELLIGFLRQNHSNLFSSSIKFTTPKEQDEQIRKTWSKLEEQGRLLLTYKIGNRGYFFEFKIFLGLVLESPLQIIKLLFPTSGPDKDPLDIILAPSNRISLARWIKQRGPSILLKNQEDVFNQQNYLRNHTGREATKLTLQDRRNQIQRVESNIDVKQVNADATKAKIEMRLLALEEEKKQLEEHLVTVNGLVEQLGKDQGELKSLRVELDETEKKLDLATFNPIPIIVDMDTLTAQREELCMASLYLHDDPSIDSKTFNKLSSAFYDTFKRIDFINPLALSQSEIIIGQVQQPSKPTSILLPTQSASPKPSPVKKLSMNGVATFNSMKSSPTSSPLPSPITAPIPIPPPSFVDPFKTSTNSESNQSKGKGKGKAIEQDEEEEEGGGGGDYQNQLPPLIPQVEDSPMTPTLPLKREKKRQKSRTPSLAPSSIDNLGSNPSTPHGSRPSTPTLGNSTNGGRKGSVKPMNGIESNGGGGGGSSSNMTADRPILPESRKVWICTKDFHTHRLDYNNDSQPSSSSSSSTPTASSTTNEQSTSTSTSSTSQWDHQMRSPSTPINPETENSLTQLFLLAYQISLAEVQAGQISVAIEAAAPILFLELIKNGLSPKGLMEGGLSETRVGLEIANKIVGRVTTFEFSNNVARYAIRVAFNHVLECLRSFSQSHPPKRVVPIPEPPCMCYLAVHPNVIEMATTTLSSYPPATITYLSTFGRLAKACYDLVKVGTLKGEEWNVSFDELNETIESSYKVLFGLIKNAVMNVKPHPDSVVALIKAQGGVWTYEMARKYRRAISIGVSVRDPQWPLKCWETVTMRHLERKIYSNVWGHSAQASKAGRNYLTSGDLDNAMQAWDVSIILQQGGEAMLYALRGMTTSHFNVRLAPNGSHLDSHVKMQLHNTREALFDATIALAIAPGLPAAKELRDSCVDTAKFLSNRKLDLEQWSCPPGFCFKDTAKRTRVEPKVFRELRTVLRDLYDAVLQKARVADRSRTLTIAVIEATTASFLAALKKGQLDKVMANPTSFVRKYGEIDRRMAEINLPLSREDEIDQAQSLFMIACTDVGRQLTLKTGIMPCMCELLDTEVIAELRAACHRELVGPVEAIRLRAPIETYADAFSRELEVSAHGVGIDLQGQPSEVEVRDAFERGTEVLWKLIERKFHRGATPIHLPESLDGIALFRTVALSSGNAKEESMAVTEDCRAWAMWSKYTASGDEAELVQMILKGPVHLAEEKFDDALKSFSLGTTPVAMSPQVLSSRSFSILMMGEEAVNPGQYRLILRDMTIALQLDQGDSKLWALRGKCLYRLDKYAHALGDLDNAFSLDPSDFKSQLLATKCRVALNRPPHVYGSAIFAPTMILPSTESLVASISYILDPSPEDLDDDTEPPPLEDITDTLTEPLPPRPKSLLSRLPPSKPSTPPVPSSTPMSAKNGKSNGANTLADGVNSDGKKSLVKPPIVPTFACPPDRHFNGISAEPENLPEVDEILAQLFQASNARTSLIIRARQLADTRELLLHHYLMDEGSDWFNANFDSVAGRNEITRGIMMKMKNMFTPAVLAGYGLEAWTTSSSNVLQMLRQLTYNEEIPCICVLSRPATFRRLRRILEEFEAECQHEDIMNPIPPRLVLPLDYDALHTFCRVQVKAGVLNGSIWRSAAKYKMKVAQLAKVFVEVFQIATGATDLEAYGLGYLEIAQMIGGVETFAMAQRHEDYLNSKEYLNNKDGDSNVYAGWMIYMSAPPAFWIGEEASLAVTPFKKNVKQAGFEPDAKMLLGAAARCKGLAQKNMEKKNWNQALMELLVASLCDPRSSNIRALSAVCRSQLPGSNQASQCVADATLAIALTPKPTFDIYYTRMQALRSLRRLKDAVADYSKGMELDVRGGADHKEAFKRLNAEFAMQELEKEKKKVAGGGKDLPIPVKGGGRDPNRALIRAMMTKRTG